MGRTSMFRQPGTLILAVVVFVLVGGVAFVLTSGALGDGDSGGSAGSAESLSGEQRVLFQEMGMT